MSDSSDEDLSNVEESDESEDEPEVPRPINGAVEFVDVAFHQSSQVIAAADMSGYTRIYKYAPGESCFERVKIRLTKKPCRCIAFSKDGEDVLTMTKDKILQIVCSSTGTVKRKITSVHKAPPYCLSVVDKNIIATGDENGVLKIWDLRRGDKAVMKEKKFDDYISDIAVDDNNRLIFAVSGDGTMATYNARQRKFIVQSENEECDLLCAKVVRNNKKLVVGTANGPLLFYSWDQFAAASDRFPGHPGSVDCMAKISDNIVCTASSDGMIRAVHIHPNRFLGVVGDHEGLPIEKVAATSDGQLLASLSHDSTIRFWNVGYLHRLPVDETEKADKSFRNEKVSKQGNKLGKARFFSDLEKDFEVPACDVDSDDVSSSEEEG